MSWSGFVRGFVRGFFRRFLASFFVLLSVWITSCWVVNSRKVALSSAVRAILHERVSLTPQQEKSLYYVLGTLAGASDDIEKAGENAWRQKSDSVFMRNLLTRRLGVTAAPPCQRSHCEWNDPESPQMQKYLQEQKSGIASYVHLVEHNTAGELDPGDAQLSESTSDSTSGSSVGLTFGSVVFILPPNQTHAAFLYQLAQWWKQGEHEKVIRLLTSSNHLLSDFYTHGNSIEPLLALAFASENLSFTQDFLMLDPKFKLSQKLVDSFDVPNPEDVDQYISHREIKDFHQLLRELSSLDDIETMNLANPDGHRWRLLAIAKLIPIRLFLQANETLNLHADLALQNLPGDCLSREVGVCGKMNEELSFTNPWHWLENPLGRQLNRTFLLITGPRRAKVADRSAKLRAGKLQLAEALASPSSK